MAKRTTAAAAAEQPQSPAPDAAAAQPAAEQTPAAAAQEAERVELPADVEPQPASTDPEPDQGHVAINEGGTVVQPVQPYVHQSGFRRVTNEQRTEVHVDIYIDAPERRLMGTTVFPSDIWSNLIAAVGK